VTERKGAEQRLVAEQGVARVLAEAVGWRGDAGLTAVACEALGWRIGDALAADRELDVLRSGDVTAAAARVWPDGSGRRSRRSGRRPASPGRSPRRFCSGRSPGSSSSRSARLRTRA
jgi:hypothetical protein